MSGRKSISSNYTKLFAKISFFQALQYFYLFAMKLQLVEMQMSNKQSAAKLDNIDKDANVMRSIIEAFCLTSKLRY